MQIASKLPNVGTTIFTVMSQLANAHGAINLSQGFPNFDCSDTLKALVTKYMQAGYNQYAPMAGLPRLREQISRKINRMYGTLIDPQTDITVTAGATQAIFSAITAVIRPGDEVILIDPAYDSYAPAILLNGGVPVRYELRGPDYRIDWAAIQNLISPRTRLLMINSPHNPTGQILTHDDMWALDRLLADTDIFLLSDEVYEHLIYDGLTHQSVLGFSNLYKRSFVTFSFGKTFHNTGWKIGYCVAPAELTAELRKVHQFNVFSVNTPMQHALASFLEDEKNYLELPAFYQQKRDLFLRLMEGSRFRPIPCRGTYFQLMDYSAISDEPDVEFAKRMTIEQGVATIPVSVFYASGYDARVVRFCFAKTPDLLEQASQRLCKM